VIKYSSKSVKSLSNAFEFTLYASAIAYHLPMTNLREFDPNKYDWVWNVLPTDILVENNRRTYTSIQRPDGRCVGNTIAVYIDGSSLQGRWLDIPQFMIKTREMEHLNP
jgi:hypothetical protein